MDVFNIPFFRSYEANLGWLMRTVETWDLKLKEFFEGDGIRDFVDEVLTSHPEWTTTIMDGSLELRKFTAALAMRTVNYYVTPEEFGAAGDGNTDDTAAVQSAFNDGRPVLMLADYKITEPLEVSTGSYVGKGLGRLLLNDTAGAASIYSTGIDNITFKGISFITQTQGHARYSLSLLSGDNIKVEDCYFEGVYGYGCRLNNTTNSIVKKLRFNTATGVAGNPGGCIYAMDAQNLTVEDVKAYDIQDHVVYLTGSDNTPSRGHTVKNINVELGGHNSLTNGAAVVIYNNCQDITVENVNCKTSKAAIQISRSGSALASPKRIKVSNIGGDTFTENGVTIAGAENYEVENITINGITFERAEQDCISLAYCKRVALESIIAGNAGRNCIRVLNSSDIQGSGITTGDTSNDNIFCDSADRVTMNSVSVGSAQTGIYHRNGADSQYMGVVFAGVYTNKKYQVSYGNGIQPGAFENHYTEYLKQIYSGTDNTFSFTPGNFDGIATIEYVPSTNRLAWFEVRDTTIGQRVAAANSTGGLASITSVPVKSGHIYSVSSDTGANDPTRVYFTTTAYQEQEM